MRASMKVKRKHRLRFLSGGRVEDFGISLATWFFFEIALFFCVGGVIFDSVKPFAFPEFLPLKWFGLGLYAKYVLFNLVASILALKLAQLLRRRYLRYLVFGLLLLSSGIANILSIEKAMIPPVWHGIFGFLGAVTVGFSHGTQDILKSWKKSLEREGTLDIKKELQKEMQWAFTTYMQVMLAFAAIFGVAMTILFRGRSVNDPDVKVTGLQMVLGFSLCVLSAYIWGVAPALGTMRWMRRRWME